MSRKILPTIACNLDADILSASLPLLEEGIVGALEWSFDALFRQDHVIPDWFHDLLTAYSNEGRLIGHGVFFSLFSGRLLPEQAAWLQRLKQLTRQYRFDHITEHFGFMTGSDFHKGAPMSVPYTAGTVAIGRDRLQRIQDAAQCPVGLENLAFAYSLDEVKRQGEFLEQLIEPVNGFIILDLHNVYCQLHNFNIPFEVLIQAYPLDRVREIHISGGSWETAVTDQSRSIRRDTHDGTVPESVFVLLEQTLPLCPQLKYVVMEQLGTGLQTEASKIGFRKDFQRMKELTEQFLNHHPEPVAIPNNFLPEQSVPPGQVIEDEYLYGEQQILSYILEHAAGHVEAMEQLQHTALRNSVWGIEKWQPDMLETAIRIARKWK